MMPIRHSPWPVPHSVKIVDMIKRKIRVKIGHNILNKTILEFENLRKQGMNRAALFYVSVWERAKCFKMELRRSCHLSREKRGGNANVVEEIHNSVSQIFLHFHHKLGEHSLYGTLLSRKAFLCGSGLVLSL